MCDWSVSKTLAGGGPARRYMQANSVPAHLGNLYLLAVLGERQGQRKSRYLFRGVEDEAGGDAAQYRKTMRRATGGRLGVALVHCLTSTDHTTIWQHGSSPQSPQTTVTTVMFTSITTNCMELFGGGRLSFMHEALTRRR